MKTFSAIELEKKFRALGLKKNDSVMLHADAIILNFIQGESNSQKIALIKDTILKILGKDGLLLVPTFTYSFIEKKKNKYS